MEQRKAYVYFIKPVYGFENFRVICENLGNPTTVLMHGKLLNKAMAVHRGRAKYQGQGAKKRWWRRFSEIS